MKVVESRSQPRSLVALPFLCDCSHSARYRFLRRTPRLPAAIALAAASGSAEQLTHRGIRHPGERPPVRLQTIEAVKDARFAQALDEIYSRIHGAVDRERLSRNDPQVRNMLRVVDLVPDDVELRSAESQQLRLGRGGWGAATDRQRRSREDSPSACSTSFRSRA